MPHDQLYYPAPNKNLTEAATMGFLESDATSPLDLGPEKAKYFFYLQNTWSLYNIIGVCVFTAWPLGSFSLDQLNQYLRAVTGWNTSLWELFKANERSQHMFRIFNCREGFTPKDDVLPDRFFEPLENGAIEGSRLSRDDFRTAIETYYGMMGWDPDTGKPSQAKLHEMGLGWVIPEIY